MPTIPETLAAWQNSLCPRIEVGGLYAKNPVAHKWKATFRSLELRETVFWRIHDLLTQTYELHLNDMALGARILLRSAMETLATLIYLNQSISAVIAGNQDFHRFSNLTTRLLLGSRDKSTNHQAVNIISVLDKCEKRYTGITGLYALLSESAHPNFEGLCFGYSRIDHDNHVVEYSNNMSALYADKLGPAIELCMFVFEHEYGTVWPKQFEKLEEWIAKNDEMLEATKEDNSGV